MFFVYVLRSKVSGRYYIGSTKDLTVRLDDHNCGRIPSTKSGRPWEIVYSESFDILAEARKREQQIKSWKNPSYMIRRLGLNI